LPKQPALYGHAASGGVGAVVYEWFQLLPAMLLLWLLLELGSVTVCKAVLPSGE